MGEVYRARDTKLGREVAIKVLPASLSQDPVARERLRREAVAAAGLDHPFVWSEAHFRQTLETAARLPFRLEEAHARVWYADMPSDKTSQPIAPCLRLTPVGV